MSILAISAIILCAVGVCATYMVRVPAVLASYAGLVCAYAAGAPAVTGSTLVFWGMAVALVSGISYFTGNLTALLRPGNAYVVTGTVAGTLLGWLVVPTAAALIGGGALGGILGALAYRSTPHGPRSLAVFSPIFVNFVCATGLRAVVACSICGIALATLI